MKKILTVLVALLTVVAFSSGVMAQAPAKPAAPAATDKPKVESPKAEQKEAPQTTEVSGTVAAYEAGKTIKVKGKDKEMSFEITGDTKVNGEVKVGAKATVTYKKVGDKMIATAITIATEKKS
ncbi:MAG TPA: hypothetical protein VK551_02725 [Thermodesulfobacteriota bacterium]|jgi:uncharacterized protein YxeA|nr:hypothetical protein [Thermodesulfobacteriota bacterium]